MAEEGVVAGKLEIPVESNTKGFGERLRAAIEKETAKIVAKVGVALDDDEFREKLEATVETAAAGIKAKIEVEIDSKKAKVQMQRLRAVLNGESKNAVDVPIKAEKKGFFRSLFAAREEAQALVDKKPVEVPVKIKSKGRDGPESWRSALLPMLFLSIASIIQPAIAAIGGSIGGLAAMLGNLASGVQVLAAGPGSLFALVGGMTAFKWALTEVSKPLDQMSPRLSKIRDELDAFKSKWDKLKVNTAVAFWKQLNGEFAATGKVTLPLIDKAMAAFGKTIGKSTADLLKWSRTPLFGSQFKSVAASSNGLLGSMGKALLGVAKGLMNIADAATLSVGGKNSLMTRLSKAVEGVGKWAEQIAKPGKDAKAFATELGYAADKAAQLWRMTKDLGAGIKGLFKAARGSGDSLLGSLETTLQKWRDWVESDMGQSRIKKWFKAVEPITREAGNLIVGIGKALARLSEDEHTASLLKRITNEVLPALEKFLKNLGKSLGPQVIDLVTNLVTALGQLSEAGSPLSVGLGYINGALKALADILVSHPGMAKTLGTILGALIAFRALQFIGNISGINTMLERLGGIVGGRQLSGLYGLIGTIMVFAGALQGLSPAAQGAFAALGTFMTLRSAFPAMQTAIAGMSTMLTEMRTQMALTAAAGGRMGGIKSGFGAAASVIGTTAKAGLRGALAGLGSLIGVSGPVGLAIVGATTAVGLWARKHAEAAQKAQEYRDYVQRIVDTLDKETGALTAATKAEVAKQLQSSGAAAAAQKYGVVLGDLTAAAMGNADAQSRVSAALRHSIAQTALATDKTGLFRTALSEAGVSQTELESALYNGGAELAKVTSKLDKAAGGNAAMQAAIDGAIRAAVYQTKGQRDLHNQVVSSTNAIKDASTRQAVFNALMDTAGAEVRKVTSSLAALPPGKTVTVKSLTADAEAKLRAMGYKVTHLPNGQVKVSASTKAAEAALNYLARKRTAHIQAVVTSAGKAMSGGLTRDADGSIHLPYRYANGGFWDGLTRRVQAFANGTERHIAQIARAGDWRLWAEPETGGEAYIPLSPAKRARSMEILKAVADHFGMLLAPKVTGIANALQQASPNARGLTQVAASRVSSRDLAPVGAGAGTQVTFEEGAIAVHNPLPETPSDSIAGVARKVGVLGLFE